MIRWRAVAATLAVGFAVLLPAAAAAEPRHGVAMHGVPRHGPDFDRFDYVEAGAPKGGALRLAVVGTFDSTNPFVVRGTAAAGLRAYVFESLMARSRDEPFSLYGLIAETIDIPGDLKSVTFRLRPEARFSDGMPVRVDDVIFSLEAQRDHGRPNFRSYYSAVTAIERPDPQSVRFRFASVDREMPLILGLMAILPKHRYDEGKFETAGLDAPLGSGPYRLERIEPGRSLGYRRDAEYWGRGLAVNRGRFNFDELRYEYFRDQGAAFEAFKKGLIDVREEDDPTRWAGGYDFPAAAEGRVVREELGDGLPAPMSALAFNTRREIFADRRVRLALLQLFDFEWANANLFHGLYRRTQSYFDNSELAAARRPASDLERSLLAPFPGAVPAEILDGRYAMPVSGGTGRDRAGLRQALELFREAGWTVDSGRLVHAGSGRQFAFEVPVVSREQERIVLHYARSLERAGIRLAMRQVDAAQFQRRLQTYDFDMAPVTWANSLSPGNEQSFYWGSAGRTTEGTRNYMGAAEPAIDAMIEALLAAGTREAYLAAARSIDRLLLAGVYAVPLYHAGGHWLARWSHIRRPAATPLYGPQIDAWWNQGSDVRGQ